MSYAASTYVERVSVLASAVEALVERFGPDLEITGIRVAPDGTDVHVSAEAARALGLAPETTGKGRENYHHRATWRGVQVLWLEPRP